MYYSGYDPAIHDIYLYGPGNVGMPIGLNPTSLIYGASADFASVQPRYRAFNVFGGFPVPPGAGVTSLPNYYNIGSPFSIVAGEKTLLGCVHFVANKPSDSGGRAKYTGTTTAYPYLSIDLWNNTLTGFCSYGPLTGIYNCVPLDRLGGGPTAYAPPVYFSGSPEIPGFATGATFYQILSQDVGFMDLIGSGPTFSQPIMKKISVSTLFQEFIEHGMTATYINFKDYNSFQVRIPAVNTYVWDGNDKVIPVDSVSASYSIYDSSPPLYYQSSPNQCDAEFYETDTKKYGGWVGDSSSLLLYMKNNSLYCIAEAVVWSSADGADIPARFGMYCHVAETLPLYNFVGPLIDKNHYSTPLNQGLTLATQSDFNTLQTTLNNFNTSVNNLYERWTT